MFFIELWFVYGSAQLQTFYGPFPTEQSRDEYIEHLHSKEDECFDSAKGHYDQGVREAAETINPNHTKHLKHKGPLPEGQWKQIPTEHEGVFSWVRPDDEVGFIRKLLDL